MQASTLQLSPDTVPSPFITSDGNHLVVLDWPVSELASPRALVLLVHGLGEHGWLYNNLAMELNAAGFAVRAYDQRGHGESSGKAGCIPRQDTLVRDLDDLIEDTQAGLCARFNTPIVLLGHGLGGIVAGAWMQMQRARGNGSRRRTVVDSLVLSSPVFQHDRGWTQSALQALLPEWLSGLTLSGGMEPELLFRDEKTIRNYRADPLVHNRISPLLWRFMSEKGAQLLKLAPQWSLPTLLLYAGLDGVAQPGATRRFARHAPTEVVESVCFEDMYHHLFHDVYRHEALDVLLHWLDNRY